jgi:hypothetical protein
VLQRAVIGVGMSRRQSALIVDTVINSWKDALARDEEIETPVGTLRTVRRKKRRVFTLTSNLKGFKRHLYDVNCKPVTVQLVNKKLEGDPVLPSPEQEESVLPALPVATNDFSSVDGDSRQFRPVQFVHLDRNDLLQRFQPRIVRR